LKSWTRAKDGSLILDAAPMRLLAIVNRIDQRGARDAGELRFVYGVTDAQGSPQSFTVSLELQLPISSERSLASWALGWFDLSLAPSWDTEYRDRLQALIEPALRAQQFLRMRTNESVPGTAWELREFTLGSSGRLQASPTPATPAKEFAEEKKNSLLEWLAQNGESYATGKLELPDRFLGTEATMEGGFRWFLKAQPSLPDSIRAQFSLRTCNGCHSGETGTSFLHIGNRLEQVPSGLSTFLNQDLERRQDDLRSLVIQEACGKGLKTAPVWVVGKPPERECVSSEVLSISAALLKAHKLAPLASALGPGCVPGFLIQAKDLPTALAAGLAPGAADFGQRPSRFTH
jgi:hypothetical protein